MEIDIFRSKEAEQKFNEFAEVWKLIHIKEMDRFVDMYDKNVKEESRIIELRNIHRFDKEKQIQLRMLSKENREERYIIQSRVPNVSMLYYYRNRDVSKYNAELRKIANAEIDNKLLRLKSRIFRKAGYIVGVFDLEVAQNGEINGVIVGTINTFRVKTIIAGGYNIQVAHFRVLLGK